MKGTSRPPSESEVSKALVHDFIDGIIVRSVNDFPGASEQSLLGTAFSDFTAALSAGNVTSATALDGVQTVNLLKERIAWLCENARVMAVEIRAPGQLIGVSRYYPSGYTLTTTPKQMLWSKDEPPPGLSEPISEKEQSLTNHIIGILNECPDSVRLRVANTYCVRCGSEVKGHFCNA